MVFAVKLYHFQYKETAGGGATPMCGRGWRKSMSGRVLNSRLYAMLRHLTSILTLKVKDHGPGHALGHEG